MYDHLKSLLEHYIYLPVTSSIEEKIFSSKQT